MATSSLYEDLISELESTLTIDAHEHLMTEEEHLKEEFDFYSLFSHYCSGDLLAAGATQELLKFWADKSVPVKERWKSFKPFFEMIRTGSYARFSLIVIRELLGFEDLSDETVEPIGEKLSEMNRPGLYDEILRRRCNLAACIQCWMLGKPGPDYFYHLGASYDLTDLFNRERILTLAKECNRNIRSLDDVLECVHIKIDQWKKAGVVGIKTAHAYSRSLHFEDADRASAERAFKMALNERSHMISLTEIKPLQDFMMHRLAAAAEDADLPLVIHTGIQAGSEGRICDANPLLLQDLLEKFPALKIDLFHGGVPFVREIAMLAKYFPGVHLNMAWMHIISPSMARSALSEWLELVPNNKIIGFGGDLSMVELVYGHLRIARENIAVVLAEKVSSGVYSRTEVSYLIRALMFDNPNRFYKLGLKR